MISAKQARNLAPPTDIERILTDVEGAVRRAASQGFVQVEITPLLPNWSGWVCGKANAELEKVKESLTKLGYRVETAAGGHAGRGYVKLHWAA